MKNLPIHEVLSNIKQTLSQHSRVILTAPPGAGKSTIVPISLLEESWLDDKLILILEPRRVAARMLATQMSKLLGQEVGRTVGYQVKLDSKYSKETKILLVTEAILIRKLQSDQALEDVSLIIFDEFHERSIHTDLSLALSLQTQELLRDDLKILIMSATLDSHGLSNLLGDVPVISSKGKIYEVENIYLEKSIKQPDYKSINLLLLKTSLKAIKEDSGDILVFLSGVKEIRVLQETLENELKRNKDFADILILPLYSNLDKKAQDTAINKNEKRKIILSTNISQTSLTIEGVKVVIDSGLEKLSRYNYSNAMNHLELNFISKDSSIQRAGRAGRLSNGKCYKLWHESKILQQSNKPEILRSDLSSLLLDLALWGVDDLSELKFLDIPDKQVVKNTRIILQELEMLDEDFTITSFGKDALKLGLHPRFAFMILKANNLGYAYEACLLASLLEQKDILKNSYSNSDIMNRFIHLFENDINNSYINRFRAKEVLVQAGFYYKKLKNIKKVANKNYDLDKDMIAVLLLFAYPDRLAKIRIKNDNKYKLSNAKGAILNIEDSLFNEEFLVVANLNAQDRNSFINQALSISKNLIEKYFFSHIIKSNSITYNKENKRLDIKEHEYFLNLELSSKASKKPEKKELKKLFLDLIKKEGLELLTWSKKALDLQDRVNFINEQIKSNESFSSKEVFEDFTNKTLLKNIQTWLEPYMTEVSTIKELESLDIYSILCSNISWEKMQVLDKLAPNHVEVPSGSKIQIDYSNHKIPILSVRLQEVFGLYETPKILNNTLSLQVHLLSPARRPIQITYDLKSFWENSYEEVRKELRGKYKRHYWPQNPHEAVATKHIKKYM